MRTKISKISIIGAGLMGNGIALVTALGGYEITVHDVSQELIDAGLQQNFEWIDGQVHKDKMEASEADLVKSKFVGELSLQKSVSDTDLVIEAVIEKMEIKQALWKKIGEYAPEHAIFGSNTSSLSITEMANSSGRPDKFLGLHFFNPPIVLRLLEYVKGYLTSKGTLEQAIKFGESIGMETVVAEDSPGFVVTRLLLPFLNEAFFALQEGLASKEDIDKAIKLGLGHPMGPLTLSDFVGLDTLLYACEFLHKEFGESKYRPCPLLRKMVRAGKLGRKTGEGFYKY